MSTICDDLRAAILQAAMQGRLTKQLSEDGNAKELLNQIKDKKAKLNIRKKELTISEDEILFEIPDNWSWEKLENISQFLGDKNNQIKESATLKDGKYKVVSQSKELFIGYCNNEKKVLRITDPVLVFGDHTALVKYIDFDFIIGADGVKVISPFCIDIKYLYYALKYNLIGVNELGGYSRHYKFIKDKLIPIPPLAEQKRIVEKVDELMARVADLEQSADALASLKKAFPDDIKASLLQAAMQGKLTKQLSEDGNAEDLLEEITISESIGARKVKKKTIESDLYEESLFEIPSSWKWVKLGSVCAIARGGSPRPIKDFLTESVDGINWIKIGDTDKGGKYIWSTKERIKKEGLAKSRMIHAGDFLLTNSMSFGRPYISKIDGCIHDGWLVISQSKPIFDENYLFYVLSSRFMYYQFCGKVSGAVVKNLNSDKVANSVVPLPPLAEQKRIVERLEKLMQNINAVGDLIASE